MLTFLKALRPEFRPTIRLALPLVIAEVGWMTMGIVDTIMVGRLPNSAVAIGATGLGQSLYNSVVIFGGGLLLGMDTLVSHAYGREDHRDTTRLYAPLPSVPTAIVTFQVPASKPPIANL